MFTCGQNMEKSKIMTTYNTNSFIIFIIAKDIYVNMGENVETRFHTSKYEVESTLLRRKNKKINWINER